MGAKLVRAAHLLVVERAAAGQPLGHNERHLLMWAANTAKDTDARPRYFGGQEHAAMGLGRRVPAEPDLDDPEFDAKVRERINAFSQVRRATRGLVECGALRRAKRGRPGVRAEYYLVLPHVAAVSPVEDLAA